MENQTMGTVVPETELLSFHICGTMEGGKIISMKDINSKSLTVSECQNIIDLLVKYNHFEYTNEPSEFMVVTNYYGDGISDYVDVWIESNDELFESTLTIKDFKQLN
jgi:hypothetical protein